MLAILRQGDPTMDDTMKNITGVRELQRILDAIPNPVILKDRDHQIVLLNTSACTLLESVKL